MNAPILASGPHTHSVFNVPRTMLAVMVCLAPATLYGLWQFGWPAVYLFLVTVFAAEIFEIGCLWLAKRPIAVFATDGSAILSGWIVALTLPPWAPWWVGVIGAGIAIVLGKQVFGGLGQNLFNPAMVARAMLLVALPVQMTTWAAPVSGAGPDLFQSLAITFGGAGQYDAVSSASTLAAVKSGLDAGNTVPQILTSLPDLQARLWGHAPGSLGEGATVLLLLGGIALMLLRIITPVIPVVFLFTLALLAEIFHLINPAQYVSPILHLTSGATMICAFFIATDYLTSPVSAAGKAIYAAGIATLVFVIRTWGSFPEGVAFAVLLMNAATPIIETYVRPRVFGRTRSGKPLPLKTAKAESRSKKS